MDPNFTQRSAMLLEQLQTFWNSINMLMCVICSNEIKDARLCPKCSYMCCFGCFKKTLETCGKFCPSCSVPLQEDQLLTIFWLEEMIALLKNTQSFLRDLPSALQRQNSAPVNSGNVPLPDLVVHEDDFVGQLADGIISVLPDAAPVCDLQSTSRFCLPVFQEMHWYVSAIQWSRVFSDLFFAGSWGNDRGLLGLFTMDRENHEGCTIELEGNVWSLDIHPNNPCLVSVGMGDSSCGVRLYLLHGGQLETADLSTCDGRRLFQKDFKASPSNYRFDRVWRVELSSECNSVFWWSPSELIALTRDRLTRLKMPQPTDEPTKEILAEKEAETDLLICMAIRRRPQLTTLHCDTYLPSMEGDEEFCKLAIGTTKGEIRVISILPSVRTEWRPARAHNCSVSAIDWNPVVPEILASCFNDGCIKLWRMGCEQLLLILQVDGECGMINLQWAPFSSTIFAVLILDGDTFLFDLAVDQENPIAADEGDGRRSYLTFHPSRPSVLLGFESGRGFEQLDLHPTPMLKRQVGARVLSLLDSVALSTETEKLKAILKL